MNKLNKVFKVFKLFTLKNVKVNMTDKEEKEKKYIDFKKTKPEQLDLFSFNNIYIDKREQYSNTVELYDIIPKYIHDDVERYRTKEGLLKPITRNFKFRKQDMILNVSPAYIFDKEKAYFPSQREEIIEDVLRKFATDCERNEFLDDRLSVKFSLYDLWKELKKIKHEYNYSQIRESLEILSKTNIEIKSVDGEISFSSNMFETFGQVNANTPNEDSKTKNNDTEEYNKNVIYFVRFNSLVSESIKNKTWRVINYEQCMKYRKAISRWLHKRISHMFLVGNIETPFNILLSTIIRDSGMKEYDLISGNIRQVEECIKEMIKIGSIDRYEIEKVFSETKKNKIEDVKFYLWVSQSFYNDIQLGFLALQDHGKIKQIQDTAKNNNNIDINNATEDENKTNDNLKEEIKFLLEKVNISEKDIKKILSSKKNEAKLQQIKQNIEVAVEYIKKESEENINCNNLAIILSSIKDNWENSENIKQGCSDEKINSDYEKEARINKIISEIKNKDFKKISINLIKYFGDDVYITWLSKLNYVSINDGILTLSCDNLFVVDNIKRNYLNGVYKKENGEKVLLRKGIKEIAQETVKGIKKIEIK